MVDIHCHILPNVDDGSRSIEESKKILERAKDSGVNKIIFTPHAKDPYYNIAADQDSYNDIQKLCDNLKIEHSLGYEVSWNKLSEIGYDEASHLTLGNSKYFLLELSWVTKPAFWEKALYELQGRGLKVILAHPERYSFFWENFKLAEKMHYEGMLFCLSCDFINRRFMHGKPRSFAKKLFKNDMVSLIASDAHDIFMYDLYDKALSFAKKYNYDNTLENIIFNEAK